jgi:hypothetical protein
MAIQHEQDPEVVGAEKGGHSATIIINARPYEVDAKKLSFEDLVNLSYNGSPPTGDNWVFTVTYSRGEHGQGGTMLPGDHVKIKNKMVFDVGATDRS